MKRPIIHSLLLLFSGMLIFLTSCSTRDGDWLGPMERTARTLFWGWDMWDTESVTPFEEPLPAAPSETVSINGKYTYEKALQQISSMSPEHQRNRGALIFQRFCSHCHGIAGDGRTIVGESFGKIPPDLRRETTQKKSERELFTIVKNGKATMLPLGPSLTPGDALLAVRHLRTLPSMTSKPFFTKPGQLQVK